MRHLSVFALSLLLSAIAFCQAPKPAVQAVQAPNYSNYSVMLVAPPGGSAVILMHNPKYEIEYVDLNKTKEAFAAGYVPVRAAEIGEVLTALREENARLEADNKRLKDERSAATLPITSDGLNATNCHTYEWLKNATVDQIKTCTSLYPASKMPEPPSQNIRPEPPSQVRYIAPPSPSPLELAAAERNAQIAARQQMIQNWLMLQNMNRPQPYQIPMPMPMPVNQNAGRVQTDCTTMHVGNMSYTNCN